MDTLEILCWICSGCAFTLYSVGVWQGRIKPQRVTWFIWSLVGLAAYVTYNTAATDGESRWAAIYTFLDPFFIFLISLFKSNGAKKKLDREEVLCLLGALFCLTLWFVFKDNHSMIVFALVLVLAVDWIGAWPTIKEAKQSPGADRPAAWLCCVGVYGSSLLMLESYTFANVILPVSMGIITGSIALPLVIHRLRNKKPIREWI